MHTYPYVLKRVFFFLVYWFSVYKTITKTQLHEKRSPEWKIDFPYWCETG